MINKIAICALMMVSSSFALGESSVSKKQLQEIQEKLKENTYLTVDFEKITYAALRNKTRKSQGMAYFKKPHYFRWVFQEPHNTELIFNGSAILSYLPDEKRADRLGVNSDKGREVKQVVNMVLDLEALLQRYDLVSSTIDSQYLNIEIAPKKKVFGDIHKGLLTIDLKNYYIENVKLYFDAKNYTQYLFKNPKRAKFSDTKFELAKGVKVTDVL